MLAISYTVAFEGVEGRMVEVQASVTPGLPAFAIVGLPDKAVSEARERVRSAFTALSIAMPSKRITVNLSPADLPKEGSHFDLPIALAILAALEVLPANRCRVWFRSANWHWTGAWCRWSAPCPPPWPRLRRIAR